MLSGLVLPEHFVFPTRLVNVYVSTDETELLAALTENNISVTPRAFVVIKTFKKESVSLTRNKGEYS